MYSKWNFFSHIITLQYLYTQQERKKEYSLKTYNQLEKNETRDKIMNRNLILLEYKEDNAHELL